MDAAVVVAMDSMDAMHAEVVVFSTGEIVTENFVKPLLYYFQLLRRHRLDELRVSTSNHRTYFSGWLGSSGLEEECGRERFSGLSRCD